MPFFNISRVSGCLCSMKNSPAYLFMIKPRSSFEIQIPHIESHRTSDLPPAKMASLQRIKKFWHTTCQMLATTSYEQEKDNGERYEIHFSQKKSMELS